MEIGGFENEIILVSKNFLADILMKKWVSKCILG